MTSRTEMSGSTSELPNQQLGTAQPFSENAREASAEASTQDSNFKNPVCLAAKPMKLPYQENHKEELLHLQADIEALLQQLQTLKQQRTESDSPEVEAEAAPVPALV